MLILCLNFIWKMRKIIFGLLCFCTSIIEKMLQKAEYTCVVYRSNSSFEGFICRMTVGEVVLRWRLKPTENDPIAAFTDKNAPRFTIN